VFLASGLPLALVPWDSQAPAFNVVPLTKHEAPVRQQVSLAHVVYAGSHTGCSCGFRSDANDPAAVARSRDALLRYIGQASATGPVEVFVCGEGEYPAVTLAAFAGDEAWLEELTFTRLGSSRP
jgi:hypothetical protein